MLICAACHRHVRELPCPFCGGTTAKGNPLPGPAAFRVGIKRSAIIAGVVTAAAACGPGGTPGADAAPDTQDVATTADADAEGPAPAYGIFPADVITAADAYGIQPDVFPSDADAAGPAPAYGVFPVDVVTAADAYGIPDR